VETKDYIVNFIVASKIDHMQQTLATLDNYIQNLRPELYSNLQAALSPEGIDVLEQKYNITLPDDLKTFYCWKNGQDDSSYEAFVNNSTFIPLEEALDTARELTDMIGTDFEIENWWNESWIPIFHNGGGSYICYDLRGIFTGQAGQLIEYWNKDNDRNVIAANLEGFLELLNGYYAYTPKEKFDDFFSMDTTGEYPKRFKVSYFFSS
jgi:cell wall assembly regulator SMI1